MSSPKNMRDYMELIWGRRYLFTGLALSTLVLAVIVSFFLPRKYESFTKVRVVDNKALYDIYGRRLAGAKDATERIRTIREEILSRSTTTDLIQQLNLDKELMGLPAREQREQRESLVNRIQSNTTVDLIETTRGQFIFKIMYSSSDPALAQRVVTHLSTSYQNRQYAVQKDTAADALFAVREKIGTTDVEYRAAADELASFEESNADHRFGQPDDTRSRHSRLAEKLNEVQVEIQGYELKLDNIRTQLADEPEWIEIEEKVGSEIEVSNIKREIREEEQSLLDLRRRFTEEHPEVKLQVEKVEHLKTRLEEEKQNFRTRIRREQNQTHVELKKSEMEAISALTVKTRLCADYAVRVRALQAQMAAYPDLKKRWEALVDRKGMLKSQLGTLRDQEESARTTWQTKVAENTLIFDVLDPPVYPVSPASPNRLLLSLGGLLLGVGLGIGAVVLRDFFDHSFRYTEEVSALVDVPVLGSIAKIETLVERDDAKRKSRVALAAVIALVAVAGAVLFLQMSYDEPISSFLRETVKLVK